MLATGLIFLFGALVAALIALLLVPIVWRQAQRLARRDVAATMPATLNEIRAEVDRVRAEAALMVRRQEVASKSVADANAAVRAEIGRILVEKSEVERRLADADGRNTQLMDEFAALTTRLDSRDSQFGEVETEHRVLREDFELRMRELQTLADRFRETNAVADERRVRLVAAETRVDKLESELRTLRRELQRGGDAVPQDSQTGGMQTGTVPGDDLRNVERSHDDIGAGPAMPLVLAPRTQAAFEALRDQTQSDTPPSRQETRERIGDIAADILYAAASAPGARATLAALLSADGPTSPLRERVRARSTASAGERAVLPSAETGAYRDGEPLVVSAPAAPVPEATVPEAPVSEVAAAESVTPEAAAPRRRGGARSRQRSPR